MTAQVIPNSKDKPRTAKKNNTRAAKAPNAPRTPRAPRARKPSKPAKTTKAKATRGKGRSNKAASETVEPNRSTSGQSVDVATSPGSAQNPLAVSVEQSRDVTADGASAAVTRVTTPDVEIVTRTKPKPSDGESIKKTKKSMTIGALFKVEPARGDQVLHSVPAKSQEHSGTKPGCKTSTIGFKQAKDFFPDDPPVNDKINRALYQRLAECWDEQAKSWTEEMRTSFWDQLGTVRVNKSSALITTHPLHRGMITGATEPNWGAFVVLRELFGFTECRRTRWWETLVTKYPVASQPPFYNGIVPKNYEDVFSGKVQYEMPEKVPVRCDEQPKKGKRSRYSAAAAYNSCKAKVTQDAELTDATGGIELPSIKRQRLSSSEDMIDLSSLAPRDAISKLRARHKELNGEIISLKSKCESTLKMIAWYEGQLNTMKDFQANL